MTFAEVFGSELTATASLLSRRTVRKLILYRDEAQSVVVPCSDDHSASAADKLEFRVEAEDGTELDYEFPIVIGGAYVFSWSDITDLTSGANGNRFQGVLRHVATLEVYNVYDILVKYAT